MTIQQIGRREDIRAQRRMWRKFRRTPLVIVWLALISVAEVAALLALAWGVGDGVVW